MNNIKHLLGTKTPLFPDRNVRNPYDLLKEEIWEIIHKESPTNSRKVYFIKVSAFNKNRANIHKLLQFKKEAEQSLSFSKAFYGKVKYYNINLDKK